MNTDIFERRTLILTASQTTTEMVNGIETVDISSLPAIECFFCDWQGHSYELEADSSQGSETVYRCPDCGHVSTLHDIAYECGKNGDVYRIQQTLDRAVQVPAKADTTLKSNLFHELRKANQDFLEGATVTNFVAPEVGSFRIKPAGEMEFTPPAGFVGISPVRVELTQNDRRQVFILRICVRSAVTELGE